MPKRKNSEARIKANNKYNEKAYDRINIAVSKGKKDILQSHAQSKGESLNAFVNRAINEAIERDSLIVSDIIDTIDTTEIKEPQSLKTECKVQKPSKILTLEAKQSIDLNRLLRDIQYQLDVLTVYGSATMSELITEARMSTSTVPFETSRISKQILERKPSRLVPATATTSSLVNASTPELRSTPEYTESISPNSKVSIHCNETFEEKLARLEAEHCPKPE